MRWWGLTLQLVSKRGIVVKIVDWMGNVQAVLTDNGVLVWECKSDVSASVFYMDLLMDFQLATWTPGLTFDSK